MGDLVHWPVHEAVVSRLDATECFRPGWLASTVSGLVVQREANQTAVIVSMHQMESVAGYSGDNGRTSF